MPQTLEELQADAMQNYAMAHHYLSKLKTVLDEMVAARSGTVGTAPVRCVREYQDWLALNGPALKSDVHAGTGVKFTERGTPYTVDWIPSLADAPDDRFAPTTLMKINAKQGDGRGAPAKVFFLWSQRWDVLPKFGVGPERPAGIDPVASETQPETWTPASTVLGVVQPEPTEETQRYASLEQWDTAWAGAFDALAASETKPTDEQKQQFRDTLPEGADANASIAIAYRNATQRLNQT
jgi:hypothetical protein